MAELKALSNERELLRRAGEDARHEQAEQLNNAHEKEIERLQKTHKEEKELLQKAHEKELVAKDQAYTAVLQCLQTLQKSHGALQTNHDTLQKTLDGTVAELRATLSDVIRGQHYELVTPATAPKRQFVVPFHEPFPPAAPEVPEREVAPLPPLPAVAPQLQFPDAIAKDAAHAAILAEKDVAELRALLASLPDLIRGQHYKLVVPQTAPNEQFMVPYHGMFPPPQPKFTFDPAWYEATVLNTGIVCDLNAPHYSRNLRTCKRHKRPTMCRIDLIPSTKMRNQTRATQIRGSPIRPSRCPRAESVLRVKIHQKFPSKYFQIPHPDFIFGNAEISESCVKNTPCFQISDFALTDSSKSKTI
jgi:hypothetical protein